MEMLSPLGKVQIYMKLDEQVANNRIKRYQGDRLLFSFEMGRSLFEPTVMQFGTTNAPVHFQWYINSAMREVLDTFAAAYLYNISIYSDLDEEHVEHIMWVIQCLFEAGLYLKLKTCKFYKKPSIQYLGLLISTWVTSVDSDKFETVPDCSWEKTIESRRLTNLCED